LFAHYNAQRTECIRDIPTTRHINLLFTCLSVRLLIHCYSILLFCQIPKLRCSWRPEPL